VGLVAAHDDDPRGIELPGGDDAAASFVASAAADAWQRTLAFLDGQPSG
jgi:hypothetical protein